MTGHGVCSMTCNIRSPSYPCRVSKMTFPVVPLLALAALCAAQSITIDVPSSPPADVSHTLDPALVSFSIELAYLDSFGGNASHPNNLTRALMANLEERTGQGPDVRPGGITMYVQPLPLVTSKAEIDMFATVIALYLLLIKLQTWSWKRVRCARSLFLGYFSAHCACTIDWWNLQDRFVRTSLCVSCPCR